MPITRLHPVVENVPNARPLSELAREPGLIAGIYDACDQWCMYCPATARCLAFRCSNANVLNGVWDPSGASAACIEGLMFIKALADAEGRAAPPEIEAILSGDPERQQAIFTLDDPLERMGGSYMTLAEAYLRSRPDLPAEIRWRPEGPTPIDVLTWYHVLAPARVFRAILHTAEERHDDGLGAAKVALIGIDRSLVALAAIRVGDDDVRLELLTDRLRRLRDAVEARFPKARRFIRVGLDTDGSPIGPLQRARRRLWALLPWRHGQSDVDAPAGDLRRGDRGLGAPRG